MRFPRPSFLIRPKKDNVLGAYIPERGPGATTGPVHQDRQGSVMCYLNQEPALCSLLSNPHHDLKTEVIAQDCSMVYDTTLMMAALQR